MDDIYGDDDGDAELVDRLSIDRGFNFVYKPAATAIMYLYTGRYDRSCEDRAI